MYTRKYRVGINLDRYARLLLNAIAITAVVSCSLTILLCTMLYTHLHQRIVDQYESTISDYVTQIDSLSKDHDAEVQTLNARIELTEEDMAAEADYWFDQYEAALAELDSYKNEAETRFDKMAEYWYVFRDAPENSGLSWEIIEYVDQLCQEWDVNPHWMWSIYWVESRYQNYIDNPTSGARGLGQVLASTGKSMWVNVLGHDTYDHSMAYDPWVNTEITVALIGRNLAKSSMSNAIELYSGHGGSSYYNAVISAGKNHGITLTEENAHYPH